MGYSIYIQVSQKIKGSNKSSINKDIKFSSGQFDFMDNITLILKKEKKEGEMNFLL